MNLTLKYLRTAVLITAVLAVAAGNLAAQSRTDKRQRRGHRMFAAQTGPDQVTLAWDEVPGATEYRIYLPDPNSATPPTAAMRPWSATSASGRRAIVSGVQKMAGGAYLMAMAGRQVLFQGKFDPVTRAPLARPSAPAAVSAQETGETEVTVSWDAVPGATAYRLGRAVGGSGYQMLCDLCPPEAVYVDTTAIPGLQHLYTVQAIFPLGVSDRTHSNDVTVGEAQLAAASALSNKPMGSGTPVAGTDADNGNVGASGGTTTTGTGTPTTGTGAGTTVTCPPGTTPITSPKTSTLTTSTKMMASGTPVGGTAADNTNVGASSGTTSTGTTPTGTTPTGCVPTGTTTGYTPPGQPAGTTPTYTPPGSPAGTTPTYTPPGTPAGTTSTYTPPGTPAGTLPAYTPPGQPGSTVPTTSTPVTATPTSSALPIEQITTLVQRIGATLSQLLDGVASGTIVHAATPVTSGTTAPTTDQLASWVTSIKSNLSELLGNALSAASASTTTASAPSDGLIALAQGVRDKVASLMAAVGTSFTGTSTLLGGIKSDVSELFNAMGTSSLLGPDFGTGTTTHAATPIGGSTPTTATPTTATPAPVTACQLDYQRADNMWAAFGRPDGPLGTETISLAPGQSRVFVTDWKYEKQRNDGTNFYGSHLRIATNRTARTVRLQLRTTTVTGLLIFARTGTNTFWIRLDPNASKLFQADLMEVFCEI